MDVLEDVDPGDHHCAVALVSRDLKAKQVLCLNSEYCTRCPSGKAIEHRSREINGDEPQPENSHQHLRRKHNTPSGQQHDIDFFSNVFI